MAGERSNDSEYRLNYPIWKTEKGKNKISGTCVKISKVVTYKFSVSPRRGKERNKAE